MIDGGHISNAMDFRSYSKLLDLLKKKKVFPTYPCRTERGRLNPNAKHKKEYIRVKGNLAIVIRRQVRVCKLSWHLRLQIYAKEIVGEHPTGFRWDRSTTDQIF